MTKIFQPEDAVIINAAPYTGWVGYVARPEEMDGVEPYGPEPDAEFEVPVRMFDAEGRISRHWFDRQDLVTLAGRSES